MKTIIGIYGRICSGKDTVAEYLEKKGFEKISLSENILKPILIKQGLEVERENYLRLGNALRDFKKDALNYLATGLMKENGKYLIPNMRNIGEAEFLRKNKDIKSLIIFVNASTNTRTKRWLARGRKIDGTLRSEFFELMDDKDGKTGLNELIKIFTPDIIINNDFETKEELYKELEKVLNKALNKLI